MKSIKKFLFIMAALAATSAFVSCSNEAQDVNVTLNPTAYDYTYYGFAKGTVVTTGATVTILSEKPFAYVEYSTGYRNEREYKGNSMSYDVTVPISIKATGSTIVTETTIDISFIKIGDTYYYAGEEIEVSGSPEDDEFTIKSIKTSSYVVTDFNFKRK